MDSSDYVERSPLFPNPLVCLRDMTQTGAYEVSQILAHHFTNKWHNKKMDFWCTT